MLRMIESVLGKSVFQNALQNYIKTYQFSNADLSMLFEKLTEVLLILGERYYNMVLRRVIQSSQPRCFTISHCAKLTLWVRWFTIGSLKLHHIALIVAVSDFADMKKTFIDLYMRLFLWLWNLRAGDREMIADNRLCFSTAFEIVDETGHNFVNDLSGILVHPINRQTSTL